MSKTFAILSGLLLQTLKSAYPQILTATRGIKGHPLPVTMTVALHFQSTLTKHRGVVWPGGVGEVDSLGLRVKLALERDKKKASYKYNKQTESKYLVLFPV